ncbi:MAG: hypothetical protein RI904_2928 [Pseudomonadota bacterium]|jgi:hypothetical protein
MYFESNTNRFRATALWHDANRLLLSGSVISMLRLKADLEVGWARTHKLFVSQEVERREYSLTARRFEWWPDRFLNEKGRQLIDF